MTAPSAPNPIAAEIGKRIRRRRTSIRATRRPPRPQGGPRWSSRMTIEQLAKASGLHPGGLARIELGRSLPTITTLFAIASALDCEPADLLPPRPRTRSAS